MSNVFQDVLSDSSSVKAQLLGPDYPYYKYIKSFELRKKKQRI